MAVAAYDMNSHNHADHGQLASDQPAIDKLVAALVRIRSVETLEGALITRHWLAADMRVSFDELNRLLKLLRWHGVVALPNEHLVTVENHEALRAIALGCPADIAISSTKSEK